MIPSNVRPGVYHIAFDTKSTPGYIRSIKVTIEVDMLPDDSAMPETEHVKYNIDLVNHPLYPELRRYCVANLPPRRKP